MEDVSAAYALLHTPIAGSPLKAVVGGDVAQLAGMLVSELPPHVADPLLRHIAFPVAHGVSFAEFYSAMGTCSLYMTFIAQAETLFRALDIFGLGAVDKVLCETALNQLQRAAWELMPPSQQTAPPLHAPLVTSLPQALAQPVMGAIAANAARNEPPSLANCIPLADFVRAAGGLFLQALSF